MKNVLYTTGEFAMMHDINKRTLHYYDEIGLFSPKVTAPNGYRYYTMLQSPDLEMILLMRKLDMSIDEIKTFVKERSLANLEQLFSSQITKIDDQIRRANVVKSFLEDKISQIELAKHIENEKILLVDLPAKYIITSDDITGEFDEEDFKIYQKFSHDLKHEMSLIKNFGTFIKTDAILHHDYISYEKFYVCSSMPSDTLPCFLRPAGKYLRTYVVGSWTNIPRMYDKIFDFLNEHHLEIEGYSYEQGINELAMKSLDTYITEITIKIKE